MCGRYTLRANLNRILAQFAAEARPEYQPVARYNIAPTQMVAAVRQADDGHREIVPLKSGLISSSRFAGCDVSSHDNFAIEFLGPDFFRAVW